MEKMIKRHPKQASVFQKSYIKNTHDTSHKQTLVNRAMTQCNALAALVLQYSPDIGAILLTTSDAVITVEITIEIAVEIAVEITVE